MLNKIYFIIVTVILLGAFFGVFAEIDDKDDNECTPGEIVRVDCNMCRCIKGNLACTKKRCLPQHKKQHNHHQIDKRNAPDYSRPECSEGQTKQLDCNKCICANGRWACTFKACINEDLLHQRHRRGAPVAADLKNTPCAPNDYFKIDCNTCYCNIDKTGYLCTQNLCSFTSSDSSSDNITEKAKPLNVSKNDEPNSITIDLSKINSTNTRTVRVLNDDAGGGDNARNNNNNDDEMKNKKNNE